MAETHINYITPSGQRALQNELYQLVNKERPQLVETVSWAASNGDRSENGDYLYGKRRLREIDRRIRFLNKRLEIAQVIDPATREPSDQVFFGASVHIMRENGAEQTVYIVGEDEFDPSRYKISWKSPLARALMGAREGDTVYLNLPNGREAIDILAVAYRAIE